MIRSGNGNRIRIWVLETAILLLIQGSGSDRDFILIHLFLSPYPCFIGSFGHSFTCNSSLNFFYPVFSVVLALCFLDA